MTDSCVSVLVMTQPVATAPVAQCHAELKSRGTQKILCSFFHHLNDTACVLTPRTVGFRFRFTGKIMSRAMSGASVCDKMLKKARSTDPNGTILGNTILGEMRVVYFLSILHSLLIEVSEEFSSSQITARTNLPSYFAGTFSA